LGNDHDVPLRRVTRKGSVFDHHAFRNSRLLVIPITLGYDDREVMIVWIQRI